MELLKLTQETQVELVKEILLYQVALIQVTQEKAQQQVHHQEEVEELQEPVELPEQTQ